MPRQLKAVATRTGHMTKAERELKQVAEEKIQQSIQKIKAPAWLSTKLKRRFNWYVKQMEGLDILNMLDANYLAQYVYYEERFLSFDGLIKETGYLTTGGKINTLLVEQRQVRQLLDKMESKLGFNPSDRLRFSLPQEEQIDELEAFRNELR